MTGQADERYPHAVRLLADTLADLSGAIAVVLGGSRGMNAADAGSDWDLVVYYRGSIDLRPLQKYGDVHPVGSWGRIMNGGGWLRVEDTDVDVLLRDIDVAMHWTRCAEDGVFEVDALLGYVAGVPTYLLAGELASGVVLWGELPVVGPVPPQLAASGPGVGASRATSASNTRACTQVAAMQSAPPRRWRKLRWRKRTREPASSGGGC